MTTPVPRSGSVRLPGVLALGLMACSLTGCFGSKNVNEHCDDVTEYQASVGVPGLTAPAGLVAPNKTSVYAVPPAKVQGELRGAACLARPPPYFRREPPPAEVVPPAK